MKIKVIKKFIFFLFAFTAVTYVTAWAENSVAIPSPFLNQDAEGIDGNLRKLDGAWFYNVLSGSNGIEYSEYADENFNFTATQYKQGDKKLWTHGGWFDAKAEATDITVSTWIYMSDFLNATSNSRGSRIFSLDGGQLADGAKLNGDTRDLGLEVRKDGSLWFKARAYDEGGNAIGEKNIEERIGTYQYPMTWSEDYKYDFTTDNGGSLTESYIDGVISDCPTAEQARWVFASASIKYDEENQKMLYSIYIDGKCLLKNKELNLNAGTSPRKITQVNLETWGGIAPEIKKYARFKMYNEALTDMQIRLIYESEKNYFTDKGVPVSVSKTELLDKNQKRVYGAYSRVKYISAVLETAEADSISGIACLKLKKDGSDDLYVKLMPFEISNSAACVCLFDISDVLVKESLTAEVMVLESLQSLYPLADKVVSRISSPAETIFSDLMNGAVSEEWQTEGEWNISSMTDGVAFNSLNASIVYPIYGTDTSAELSLSDISVGDDGYFMLMLRGIPNKWFGTQCVLAGISGQNTLKIIKRYWNGKTLFDNVLAETEFTPSSSNVIRAEAIDNKLSLYVDGSKLLTAEDEYMPILFGYTGIYSSNAVGNMRSFEYKKLEDSQGGEYDNLLGGGFGEDKELLEKYYN